MDERDIRTFAEKHAEAVVAGDMRTAGADLTKEGAEKAGPVMSQLPRSLEGAEILAVTSEDDRWIAQIAYRGEGREVKVASTWAERGDRPKIVDLEVV
jgi:hypothetical protein